MNRIIFIVLGIYGFFSLSGCTKPVKPEEANIISLTASSTLKDKGDKYKAGNLIDKAEGKSWCEGKDDNGQGESITIKFDKKVQVNEIYFKNGLDDLNYWLLNGRVSQIQIGETVLSLVDQPLSQKIALPKPFIGQEIQIIIKNIYPGAKFKDTCLSKISFTEIKDKNKISLGDMPEVIGTYTREEGDFSFFPNGTCVLSYKVGPKGPTNSMCVWHKTDKDKFKAYYNPPREGRKTLTFRYDSVYKQICEETPDGLCYSLKDEREPGH